MLRFFMCLSLLSYVFVKYDPTSILRNLKNLDFFQLIIGWLLLYTGVLISSTKWGIILRCYNKKMSFMHLFRLYIEASFLNLFFPGFVAGDLSRIARSSPNGKASLEAAFAVFLERFSGVVFICLYVGCISILGGYRLLGHVWHRLIFITVLIVLVMIFFLANIQLAHRVARLMPLKLYRLVENTSEKIQHAINVFVSRPAILLQILIWTALFFFTLVCAAYFISRSVNFDVPFRVLLAFVPLTAFISSLPVSIAGVGVRENLNVIFYSALGFSPQFIIPFGLVTSTLALLISFSGGLLILINSLFQVGKLNNPTTRI